TVDLSGLSKSTFFDAIVKERSLEFGGEGIRKYDLKRWNLLATKIAKAKQDLTDMGNGAGTWATLPKSMYYKNASTADDQTLWANSFYLPTPSAQPANTTKVTWLGTAGATNAIIATALARFA